MKKSLTLSNVATFVLIVVLVLTYAQATKTLAQSPQLQPSTAESTSFTEQGQLTRGGTPVTAQCDLQYGLWDSATGGNQLGTQTDPNVSVQNGLFTAPLNFGNLFTGDARYLETAVKCPGDSDFTPMTRRTPVDAAPYAMGLVPGTMVRSTTPLPQDSATFNAVNSRGAVAAVAIDGLADANSGDTTGVQGRSQSPTGYGVVGKNTAGGYAGYFSSNTPQTIGGVIAGALTARNGASNGIAVLGLATAPNGNTTGVDGESNSSNGFGVVGKNTNGGYAAYFSSNTPRLLGGVLAAALKADNSADGGIAIFGFGGSTNNTVGVYGRSDAPNGIGVYGENGTGGGYAGYFNGKTHVGSLEIGSGSDVAERFEVSGADAIEPGTLMVIDPTSPGKLKVSDQAYDAKVAGIVSGAGGLNPGLTLHQAGLMADDTQVAIAGRVYVKAEALATPIKPGDLLTTSSIPGYAMKATDRDRSHGAIIGKALTSLDEATGFVLVLVNLQ